MSAALRADIATYRAEARFLRALSYWHGIDLFGDIPLLTEDDPLGLNAAAAVDAERDLHFVVSAS